MKAIAARTFLLLTTLEGAVALLLYYTTASMEKNAVLWGLSLPRLVLGVGVLILWIGVAGVTAFFIYQNPRQEVLLRERLTRLLPDNNRFAVGATVIVYGLLLELVVVAIYFSPWAGFMGPSSR